MRYIPPGPSSYNRSGSRKCEHPKCSNSTREQKPFCPKHIEQQPYVQKLMGELKSASKELSEATDETKKVKLDSPMAKEIISMLEQHGERSIPRLAKDLNMSKPLVSKYAKAMVNAGIVTLRVNTRKTTFVKLAE